MSTSGLPSGTVTFLFADIEGSTKRWEKHHDVMQLALQRHDDILRHAIESNGGYVFKTVGDAFCAAFSTAMDALVATLSAQRALQSEEWPPGTDALHIRVGLHTGAAQERDGDYFGPTLNRVARLQAAGHGQQSLLSQPTFELVRDHLPQGVSLLDMGEHSLKDLLRPEHLYQVVTKDLPSEFPPLKTLDNHPNNLPRQITAFVGREKEVATLTALLQKPDVALVTLTGAGGTGKTRLALQAAADLVPDQEHFSDGVWFVELAALVDIGLVIPTIAAALGVKEAGSTPILETLKAHLKERHLLLVLDNVEQVVGAAPQVAQLFTACPHLKVVVTSRVPLRIKGEKEYPVSPLALPPDTKLLLSLERLTQYEAVRLFIDRATDVKPDFEVTNDNAPAVAEICARLDGLPLAIELAAARIRLLPPQAMLSRLQNRLKLLTGGARDLPARQQTLRNTIEWSYDLLGEGEKQLFRRMAPFSGGRTLEALETVCNYDGRLEIDVLDGVEALLSNSLLRQREGRGGEPRFWMLETIHEYAREKLRESGEADALRREHALYFVKLAEEAEPHLTGPRQLEWLDRLEDEHDNIRAALRWAGEQAETGSEEGEEIGLRIGGAIWRFWAARGMYREGREYLEKLISTHEASEASDGALARQDRSLSVPGTAGTGDTPHGGGLSGRSKSKSKSRAKALNGAGTLAWRQGDLSSAKWFSEAALAIGQELGDKQGMAGPLNMLGIVAMDQGDYPAARALFEESLALKRELGDKWGIAGSLTNLVNIAREQGDYSAARALCEESLAVFRELGDKWGMSAALSNLGLVAQDQGDHSAAWDLQQESLAAFKELGDKWGIATSLTNLGIVACERGDYPAARALYEESLALRREAGAKGDMVVCLAGLAGVAVGERRLERGTRLLGAVDGLLHSIGMVLNREERLPFERNMQQARLLLGDDAFEQAWQEGQAMSMEEAVKYALGTG